MNLTKQSFSSLASVIPDIDVTTDIIKLVDTYGFIGQNIEIDVISGSIWLKPGTSVSTSTGNKLTGASFSLNIDGELSIISDETGATIQIWVYR